jgi:hypothetical protein
LAVADRLSKTISARPIPHGYRVGLDDSAQALTSLFSEQ